MDQKPSSPEKASPKECYVIDANFFIYLNNMHDFALHMGKFSEVAQKVGAQLHISEIIFKELKFLDGTLADKFRKWVNVDSVNDLEIQDIKQQLVKLGIRTPAQDPDLSQVALAQRLHSAGTKTFLVSDDVKLGENVQTIKSPVEVLALGAFMLKFQNFAQDPEDRRYFKDIRKEILSYTISYALQHSDVYPAQQKIMWLLERNLSIVEETGVNFEVNAKELTSDKTRAQFESCDKYLMNRKMDTEELQSIGDFTPFLDEIILSRREIDRAKTQLGVDDQKGAVKTLRDAAHHLFGTLQLSNATLEAEKAKFFERIVCADLARSEFLYSTLLINNNKLNQALRRLDQAALYSSLSGNANSTLVLNHLKAMILVFNGKYSEAVNQYWLTADLARRYKNHMFELKSMVGQAIALFFTDLQETAIAIMGLVTYQIETEGANLDEAQIMFAELGDYFYALGRPDIAGRFYDESLECAIDANLDSRVPILIQKLKRSSLAAGFKGYSAAGFAAFIDKIYEVRNHDKYNEAIAQIAQFNRQFYEDFPYLTPKNEWVPYSDLPENLRVLWEIVEIKYLLAKKTLLLAYNDTYGLVGFQVPATINVEGVLENYTLELTRKAKVQITAPPEEIRAKYLIRVLITTDNANGVVLSRVIPRFFQEVKV